MKYINRNGKIYGKNIKEQIIVSFNINEKRDISDIKFNQPSNYSEINKEIQNAILNSALELPRPEKETTHTLYFEI